jgi:formylglycine-generating enzyme required for sulfatase activity
MWGAAIRPVVLVRLFGLILIAALCACAVWPPPSPKPSGQDSGAPTWRAGHEFDDCNGANWCPRMVVISAGSFTMGSPDGETGRGGDEGPQRRVSVRQFAVGKFEVTFNEWDACVHRGGCDDSGPLAAGGDNGWGRGNRPLINVSWDDARQYVRWLSNETRQSYRLLSEAEWEYAARAGATGSGGDSFEFDEPTLPVGSYQANAFGLHDMHGNAWEWVQDCYAPSYAGLPIDGSANETSSCSHRVVRGGARFSIPAYFRTAYHRERYIPSARYGHLGFRVARTLD